MPYQLLEETAFLGCDNNHSILHFISRTNFGNYFYTTTKTKWGLGVELLPLMKLWRAMGLILIPSPQLLGLAGH